MSVDVRGLKITIGGKPIVSDADMTIADGERVGLIGSSGSGKSMIAKAMLGLLPLTAVTNGSIDMGSTEIIGASERALADLRGRYVGAVFQNPAASLNPVMTVAQQIALPLRLHYDLTKAERADRVNALLSKVGLDLDMAGKYPRFLRTRACHHPLLRAGRRPHRRIRTHRRPARRADHTTSPAPGRRRPNPHPPHPQGGFA